MRNCCICSSNVGTVGRTRCKLLNRPSCNGEKAYLEKIATKWLGVSLTDFKDIGQNPDATVCYCCLQKLTKCDKFEQDLHKFTQELVQHLRKLSVVRTDKGSQERPKRSVSKSAERRASKLQRISSKRHSHLLNSINDILCGTQRQSTIYKICRSAEQVVSAKFTRPFPRGGAYNL